MTCSWPALAGGKPDKVSFYFAAHEDDWQLFMNPSAFQDVLDGASKTVFVHVTAGDAGLGTGQGNRKRPYYLARENGAQEAVRFMADTDHEPSVRNESSAMVNAHRIFRIAYRNTVSYFLRVPDGNIKGEGFADTGFQSLLRLHKGAIAKMTAVDGSTEYRGWGDLVRTVRAIVDAERGRASLVQINVAETDQAINPDDHADHLMTAQAALDAVKDMACVRRVSYVDYASAKLPENLNAQQRDMESSVFAVTLAGVQAFDHSTSWRHYDGSYVGRNYFRVKDAEGSCAPAAAQVATAHH
ncbi:MAG TPA: hypothetical protein VFP74_04200 [Pseudolabrys sp.]|nr:hypothetical protein [Pseudolabrys sp.]HEX2537794.1 hypothetical protein [Pseudolabrys sp.]